GRASRTASVTCASSKPWPTPAPPTNGSRLRNDSLISLLVKQFLLGITVVMLNGCGLAGDWSVRSQIKRYRGDGVIYACSNALSGGYSIDFPRFDAARSFTATYQFSNVPNLYRKPYLYLRHGAYPKQE